MEHLVVDVDLSQLGGGPILTLLLQPLLILLLGVGVAKFLDAGGLDETRQLPRRLLDAALPLQKLSLLAPVRGHRDGVAIRLEVNEQPRVRRAGVPHLHHLGLGAVLLELGDLHPRQQLLLLPAELILVVVGVFAALVVAVVLLLGVALLLLHAALGLRGVHALLAFDERRRHAVLARGELGEDLPKLLERLAVGVVNLGGRGDVLDDDVVLGVGRRRRLLALGGLLALALGGLNDGGLALLLLRSTDRSVGRLVSRGHAGGKCAGFRVASAFARDGRGSRGRDRVWERRTCAAAAFAALRFSRLFAAVPISAAALCWER